MGDSEPEEQWVIASGLVLLIALLYASLLIGYLLRRLSINRVHEAAVALVLGIIVSAIVRLGNGNIQLQHELMFDKDVFSLFLLPPIIFEASYNMQRGPFFRNLDSICIFAFAGTFLSTAAVGVLVWGAAIVFGYNELGAVECLVFGSLISATDPVTVLALFQRLNADTTLYANVFGESVLNDAVAIVLYQTMASFQSSAVTAVSIAAACARFVAVFCLSVLVGGLCGSASSLLCKHTQLREEKFRYLECSLAVLTPYISWMLAQAGGLSGIVAIMFCGIIMAKYTLDNLSRFSRDFTQDFFRLLALLCELFVFIYMGLAVFLYDLSWEKLGFAVICLVIVLLARCCNVYPCAALVNSYRHVRRRIPSRHVHVMFAVGLRGAIAFTLALEAEEQFPGEVGKAILTLTIVIIIFTVLVVGSFVPPLLDHFECYASDRTEDDEDISGEEGQGLLAFSYVDRHYIHPFLTDTAVPGGTVEMQEF
eukprot:Rmarinus@m.9344